MLSQQIFNALVLGSVYALFAVGFTLTFGVLRVINLLYGFYVACGAFLALLAVQAGLPLIPAAVLGTVGTGLIAILCDTALLAPLRRARAGELASLIVTLGGVLLLISVMNLLFGAEVRRFPAALLGQDAIEFGPLTVAALQPVIIGITLVLVSLLFWFLARTRTGAALRALAENPDAAALMGVNVGLAMTGVSFVSAALSAVAGILIGLNFNAVHPYMGETMMLRGFAIIIIGGLGDIRGALLAALALGFLEVMTAAYLSSTLKEAVPFGLLVLTLWLRPTGLFAEKSGKRA